MFDGINNSSAYATIEEEEITKAKKKNYFIHSYIRKKNYF